MNEKNWYFIKGDKLFLNVFVQPKASKNEIAGPKEDFLKIKVTAPPSDNLANKACMEFIAELFSISKSKVTIISGHTSRRKKLAIEIENPEEVFRKVFSNFI